MNLDSDVAQDPGMGRRRAGRRPRAGLLLAGLGLTLALSGCSVPLADMVSPIGLPEGAPARPENPPAFPAVHDMPPARPDSLLEPEEQKRLQAELNKVRAIQEQRAGASRRDDDQLERTGKKKPVR